MMLYIGPRTARALKMLPYFKPPRQIVSNWRRPKYMPRWKWRLLKRWQEIIKHLAWIKFEKDWNAGIRPDTPPIKYYGRLPMTDEESKELEKICEPMYHGR